MKRYILFVLTLLACFALVGCGNGNNGGDEQKKTTLTFASWGDATLEQAMIDAFMAKYPHIKVLRDTTITDTGNVFTENLIKASQAGTLPDVFVTDNVPNVIAAGIARDVSSYWNKDPDTQLVYEKIAQTGIYNGKRLAVPSYQFVKGMLVNLTLLRQLTGDPGVNWTYEEFKNIVSTHANTQLGGQTIYGINGFAPNGGVGTLGFEQIMPPQDDTSLGYDTWNGTSFNYENPLWIKYRKETDLFFANRWIEQLSEEEKQIEFGNPSAYPFGEGRVLFGIEGSWQAVTVMKDFASRNIDVQFYPFPGGTQGQKMPIILDYMCVSSKTKFPEEAYELVKWMSFGRDGWNARLQIMKDLDQTVTMYPVADYPEVWQQIKDDLDASPYYGLKAIIDLIHDGVPDCDKWLPGYNAFWTWVYENADTQGFWSMEAEQLASIWSAELNRQVQQAYQDLGLN